MIYLGINCGLGNHDCAMLRFDHLNLQRGWVDFPRPKTGIDRRCPLWPETVQALKAAIKIRPEPKLPVKRKNARKAKPEQNIEDYIDRVFITKYGQSWEPKSDYDNPISKETTKLLKDLEVHRKGVGFYALRHTFQTIGGQSRDRDAVRYIMGHVEDANDMSARYTEETVSDDRLKAVTDYVRDWFRSAKPKGKRKSA
jgi:integrase